MNEKRRTTENANLLSSEFRSLKAQLDTEEAHLARVSSALRALRERLLQPHEPIEAAVRTLEAAVNRGNERGTQEILAQVASRMGLDETKVNLRAVAERCNDDERDQLLASRTQLQDLMQEVGRLRFGCAALIHTASTSIDQTLSLLTNRAEHSYDASGNLEASSTDSLVQKRA